MLIRFRKLDVVYPNHIRVNEARIAEIEAAESIAFLIAP